MPCFLNVIVGSKSVPDASVLSPGPVVYSIATWPSDAGHRVRRDDEDRAAGTGRLGGILEKIGQDALHEIRARMHSWCLVIEPEMVDRLRMDGPQERHALGDERVHVQHFAVDRRLAGEFEKARTRRSSDSISLTTIWTA